ncbi:MAG: class I SAM-dependent methyltransferase [Mesorhizobium sp.]|nr:MAG: class I SAM-dependent methyltransferase [Mesorhizobium sp.]
MLVEREACLRILRCPRHGVKLVQAGRDSLVSDCPDPSEALEYPVVDHTPILIDFEDSILDRNATVESAGKSLVERKDYRGIFRIIKHTLSPRKGSTRENVSALMRELKKRAAPIRMLMVGGGSIGQGMRPFYDDPDIQIYAFDIYKSPLVQFIADAHHVPLPDRFFDVVVIQAVLEHVLRPSDVVAEIWRVLKDDGLVYAETPFMQQVHEGAYDFTRFTESGHRYLFRRFDVIHSGASGGPGIQFMWSVDYLARSVFRSRAAGKLAKLAVFWAQYLDRVVPSDYAVDGASGVFFLGRKAQSAVRPFQMVEYYQGAQKPRRRR